MAMSRLMAFSNASKVAMPRGRTLSSSCSYQRLASVHHQAPGLQEQLLAVGVGGEQRAVAGQRQAQGLGEAVHGVGREHARAGAAGGAGERSMLRDVSSLSFGLAAVTMASTRSAASSVALVGQATLPASIGPPETKTVGMLSRMRRHQHARGDLVAVGDADQGVGAVGVDHVLHRCRRSPRATAASRACRRGPWRCRRPRRWC
jgi:hypothetical protein